METSAPKFYYIVRHPQGDMVGVHTSETKYGEHAMLGAYKLEPTTQAVVETIEQFGSLEDLPKEEIGNHIPWEGIRVVVSDP